MNGELINSNTTLKDSHCKRKIRMLCLVCGFSNFVRDRFVLRLRRLARNVSPVTAKFMSCDIQVAGQPVHPTVAPH